MIDIYAAYRNAVMHKTNPSHKEALEQFLSEIRSKPEYLEILATEFFERRSRTHWQISTPTGVQFERIKYQQNPQRSKRNVAHALSSLKDAVRNAILMDLEMPNGKLLRFATGAECKKAGGFYDAIAKELKPTQVVGRHLTEDDLIAIRSRYYLANRSAECSRL